MVSSLTGQRKYTSDVGRNRSPPHLLDRCRCGDANCGTFYAEPKPEGSFGPGHRNVVLTPDEGTVILDVVAGQIACVEVLDRPDIREKLAAVLP